MSEGAKLIALESDSDGVVPSSFATLPPSPRQANVHVLGVGHMDYLVSPAAFRFVAATLAQ